jgi:hypothetical protein
VRTEGAQFNLLIEEMDIFISANNGKIEMKFYLSKFSDVKSLLVEMTTLVIKNGSKNPDEIGAASYSYMELMGLTLYCFMWQKIILATIEAKNSGQDDKAYYDGLIAVGSFFFDKLLPRSISLAEEIRAGAKSVMSATLEQF